MQNGPALAAILTVGLVGGWAVTKTVEHLEPKGPKTYQQLPAARSADGMPTRRVIVTTAKTADLASVCHAETSGTEGDMCTGYIMAAFDAASVDGAICPSASVDTMQVLGMGRTALTQPGAETKTPSAILGSTFRKAWPCGAGAGVQNNGGSGA